MLPEFTQTYTFYTQNDDGAKLWVDGELLIDDWTGQSWGSAFVFCL